MIRISHIRYTVTGNVIAVLFLCILAHPRLSAYGSGTYPHSDPANLDNWILREDMSDEFDGTQLDEDKWLIQGRDGVYRSNFIGREYWQFAPENVRVEDGMLKITTKHEPDYPWNPDSRFGTSYCEFTTAGVSTKERFTYGYMEIKCKAANAATTCSFWTTGMPEAQLELDVFEAIGKHSSRTHLMWSTIHDWEQPRPNDVWTQTVPLPFSFGDGFHVYGAECDPDFVRFYADGQLVGTATRAYVEQMGDRWPMDGGQYVWVDSEIFEWWGWPDTADLPADYEIEYVRIWEKGPTPPWREYVAQYSLPGAKSDHSDADQLSDWQEYVFNGNPTNPADTGVVPAFDPATGDYTFQLRNDTNLLAQVITTTNLAGAEWRTNDVFQILSNDGMMGTHLYTIDTSNVSCFVKLLVNDLSIPPHQVIIGDGGSVGAPSSGNGNFEGNTGSGASYPFSQMPHWFNLSGSELGNCGTSTGMAGSPEPASQGCLLNPAFKVCNNTGYSVQTIDETFDISLAGSAHGYPLHYHGDEQLRLYLFTSDEGVDEDTVWSQLNVLASTAWPVQGGWSNYSADNIYTTKAADIGKTIYLGMTLDNPTAPTVYPRFDVVKLEVNKR